MSTHPTFSLDGLAPVNQRRGWIGVDLDGTLARYDGWQGPEHIGEPVAPMLAFVKEMLADSDENFEIRIFTARVSVQDDERAVVIAAIDAWCTQHLGRTLPITCVKDFAMRMLFDDRAVQVLHNTGLRINVEE